jgi:hypothetical protein
MRTYFLILVVCSAILVSQIGCELKSGGIGLVGIETLDKNGKTIEERYKVQEGFERVTCAQNSFGEYLRNLKLKPHGSKVLYYNGEEKPKSGVYDAVVDMEIGNKNLQQCADAVMRLRAEYLFEQKEYNKIHFNFTNGFNCEYSKWKQGYRVKVNGNKTTWVKSAQPSSTYTDFRKYMDLVFNYAGTLSLSKELKSKSIGDMNVGDVFIKGGSPGHAVIVVDMLMNTKTKNKYFMLAQSYMPAQETQILLNPNVDDYTVWYKLDINEEIIQTPEWRFTRNDLKSFE